MLINGRFMARPPTGVDRVANELIAAMGVLQPGRLTRLAIPVGTLSKSSGYTQTGLAERGLRTLETGTHSGHVWEQFDLPRAARDEPLLNLCNTAPLMREQQLVMIHDLGTVANAANYGLAFRNWYRVMHRQVMKRSRAVATVSRFSADELTGYYGKRKRGVDVIHLGGEHILRHAPDTSVIERLGLSQRRFVLAVGSQSPNKNFISVVRAVELLADADLLVVAVGKQDSKVFSGTGATPADSKIKMTGYVSDGELRALYESAACFVFPSFYEGFGLPPLEAMCCGCPVIVSDRASLPEVCADAALYCKAEDPATLTAALKRVLNSSSLRSELVEAGKARAGLFGWSRSAAHFAHILDANFN